MVELAILIPVLRRPQNISPLVTSIINNTNVPYEIVFIASPGDWLEIDELEVQNQFYLIMDKGYENFGDYARKINYAFTSIEAVWYFLGADDLRFYPNWFEAAMVTHAKTGACVIGTDDLGNPFVKKGEHSTHSLVLGKYASEYGTIDEPGKILHEGYPHEYVDSELVETAQRRESWAFSQDSKVEHLHPNWGKSKMDPIYAEQFNRMHAGKKIYDRRRHLWS